MLNENFNECLDMSQHSFTYDENCDQLIMHSNYICSGCGAGNYMKNGFC